MRPLSTPMKATIVGVSISLAIIGVLATIFRRRKARPPRKPGNGCDITTSSRPSAKSPNVDIPSSHHSQSNSPSLGQLSRRHTNSTCSAAPSSVSTITTHNLDTGNMSPQHLCQLGLDSLNSAIDHWQEALLRIEDETDASTIVNCDVVDHESHGSHGTNDLRSQIESLLDRANGIQQEYQRRLYRQASAAALDSALSALSEMDRVYEREHRSTMSDDSDQDSFVSASEMADLSDLDNQNLRYQHLFLYKAALLELEHGCIPCRELRTKTVMCSSDAEFLAKLHCLRLGFEELFRDESVLSWFTETCKQLLTDILIKADRDPEDFRVAFDQTIEFVSEADNRKSIEEELRGRGVKNLGFYDLVLDFILMDAFDDLESPPSSVTAVLQNRWLSNGFKETALSTAVWSVLKAKRRLLKVPNGFISHFYSISEHISPVLAWGFLGPDEKLRELCYFFKDQVMEFLHKAFSFSHVRYTTIPELADDILYLAKEQCQIIGNALTS